MLSMGQFVKKLKFRWKCRVQNKATGTYSEEAPVVHVGKPAGGELERPLRLSHHEHQLPAQPRRQHLPAALQHRVRYTSRLRRD